jgi:elongation factor Ts
MADFSAKDVKALRDQTGAGMMDAKKALTENDGDFEAATQWLREKGLNKAADRGDRENADGAISVVRDGNTAAIVQLKSETDFSAKSEDFRDLVDRMAQAVLANGEGAIEAFTEELDTIKISKKENIELGVVAQIVAAEGNVLDTYQHTQDGRGTTGVVVEASGIDEELAHELALHIAFAKPTALSRDEIPADEVEKERAALLDITKAEGKPEQAWDKIVEGRIGAWFGERVLPDQGWMGEKEKVKDKLGSGEVARFVLATIGS